MRVENILMPYFGLMADSSMRNGVRSNRCTMCQVGAKPSSGLQIMNSSTQDNSAPQPCCFIFDVMGWRLILKNMAKKPSYKKTVEPLAMKKTVEPLAFKKTITPMPKKKK